MQLPVSYASHSEATPLRAARRPGMQSDAKNLPEPMMPQRDFASSIRNGRACYNDAIVRNSSEVNRIDAAARFSSR